MTEREKFEIKYTRWYDKMVTFVANHYNCQIKYPRNLLDIDSTLDGLEINFDCGLHIRISNMVFWQIYITETRNRVRNMNYNMMQYIDNSIMSYFKKTI